MIEAGDDDDLRMRHVFSALRRHVVRVSNEFGERLGVRLLALAAARDKSDPSLITIFGDVMLEAVTITLSPLDPGDASAVDAPPTTTQALAPKKEDDDA